MCLAAIVKCVSDCGQRKNKFFFLWKECSTVSWSSRFCGCSWRLGLTSASAFASHSTVTLLTHGHQASPWWLSFLFITALRFLAALFWVLRGAREGEHLPQEGLIAHPPEMDAKLMSLEASSGLFSLVQGRAESLLGREMGCVLGAEWLCRGCRFLCRCVSPLNSLF